MRRVGFFLVAAFLLFTGVIGIRSAVGDWGEADTLGRIVCTVFITLGGCLGVGAGVGVLARKPWVRILILAWAVSWPVSVILACIFWTWPGLGPFLLGFSVAIVLTISTYLGWQASTKPLS